MTAIPLYQTREQPCSYLESQRTRSIIVGEEVAMNTEIYGELLAKGFRRSGDLVYTPNCLSCQACIPTRIEVKDFYASRQQRRCLKYNSNTKISVKKPSFEPAHYALYQQYLASRHESEQADDSTPEAYLQFLDSSWCNTWFVEFTIEQKLAALAVVDLLPDALSAVYTFFDPNFSKYSPGVFAVLWQIQTAQQLGLEFVYLGFWIKNCRKMSYKNQYQPLSGLINQQWQIIAD